MAVGRWQAHASGELPELAWDEGVDLLLPLDGEPGQEEGRASG